MSGVHGGTPDINIGGLLRGHRQRALLTQEELAARTGLSVRTIRRLESNQLSRPRPATVRVLAGQLDLSATELDALVAAAERTASDAVEERTAPAQQPADGPKVVAPHRPAQLPLGVPGFVGRAGELARLDTLPTTAALQPTAVVVCAISGGAGVGKSAIAVHWAHRVRDHFPDGQLHVNLRGFDPGKSPMPAEEAIRDFLDALDVSPQRIPASVSAQVGLYRTLLATRRMLIVLDNAHDADQVRPLLPGSAGCLVLVTGRSRFTSLVAAEGAQLLELDVLAPVEARELLSRRLGPARLSVEPRAVDEIISRCAGLPLALNVLAARAATRPVTPLVTLADQLRDTGSRLEVLTGGDDTTDVRAVFSWSYHALGTDAARLFRLLGLHPGPDITAPAAASLAGAPVGQVQPVLADLVDAHLVTEHSAGRYALHDLLRAYAVELAGTAETGPEHDAALRRTIDHYLHTAHAADRLLRVQPFPLPLAAPQPGVVPESLADHQAALAWLSAERHVLLAVIDQAATRFDTELVQLSRALWTFFDRRGYWHDWAAVQTLAVQAALRIGDPNARAHAHRGLGLASGQLQRHADAVANFRYALELFRELGDPLSQANNHLNIGWIHQEQGDHEAAVHHAEQALALFEQTGHVVGQAAALNGIGWCLAHLGDHERALRYCRRALALARTEGARSTEASAWDTLAYIHQQQAQLGAATRCYQRSLHLSREDGDRDGQARKLCRLAETRDRAGDRAAARAAWEQALEILDELGHPDAAKVRSRLTGLGR